MESGRFKESLIKWMSFRCCNEIGWGGIPQGYWNVLRVGKVCFFVQEQRTPLSSYLVT